MFGPPDERTLVSTRAARGDAVRELRGSTTSLTDHLNEQLRLSATEDEMRLRRRGDHREPGRGRLPAGDARGDDRDDASPHRRRREGAGSGAELRSPRRRGARPPRVPAASSSGSSPSPTRSPSRSWSSTSTTSSAAGTPTSPGPSSVLPRPDQGGGRGDRRPGAQARPAVRRVRHAVRRAGRIVHKTDDGYAIVLNDDGIPRLRINSLYRSCWAGKADEARRYVEDRLRSAIWLIKSVHQRQRTLYRVTDTIVKFQQDFLAGDCRTCARCRCAMSPRTSACTSPRSAGSPPTSTSRPRRGCSS